MIVCHRSVQEENLFNFLYPHLVRKLHCSLKRLLVKISTNSKLAVSLEMTFTLFITLFSVSVLQKLQDKEPKMLIFIINIHICTLFTIHFVFSRTHLKNLFNNKTFPWVACTRLSVGRGVANVKQAKPSENKTRAFFVPLFPARLHCVSILDFLHSPDLSVMFN